MVRRGYGGVVDEWGWPIQVPNLVIARNSMLEPLLFLVLQYNTNKEVLK
jgi:hypothetical protein